ncbi:MAG: radical SAM family heme chaperone HemW [Candidatus Omnitrophica bacterium]|nr:radical SAM family heme chaperone HemW [Candidatus Omnitrophota bacterium]
MKSLYIHIPFCQSRCGYCDFYTTIYKRNIAVSFVSVLAEQIRKLDCNFETIYIGGGTPTILDIDLIEKLLKELKRLTGAVKEFTIEANPDSLSEDKLKLFSDYSVNRISIGCQSFNKQKLDFLDRAHSVKQALDAIEKAKKSGFNDISIDLIYGLPAESYKVWQKDLDRAIKLPVTHLSAYMLTYEKGTSLYRRLKAGGFLPLTSGKVAQMYEQLIEQLEKSNFFQYEISNFSKKKSEAIHNLRYWENKPYMGLGPSAASFSGGRRQRNISCLPKYIEAVRKQEKIWEYSEKLSPFAAAKETAALKIRTKEGVDFNWFRQKTGFSFLEIERKVLPLLLKQKLIKYGKDSRKRIKLTKKGFLFADTVSATFL